MACLGISRSVAVNICNSAAPCGSPGGDVVNASHDDRAERGVFLLYVTALSFAFITLYQDTNFTTSFGPQW